MNSTKFVIAGVILLVAAAAGLMVISKSATGRATEKPISETWVTSTPPEATTTKVQPIKVENKTPVMEKSNNKHMNVTLKTNMGDITLELYEDKAPKAAANFVKLAKEGFYDGTKFHRVIHDFMIQGGDPLTKDDSKMNQWGTGGPGYQFENENDKGDYTRGILAMANAGPNTNGSQFFIVTAENVQWFKGGYSMFGRVTGGLDTAMKIDGVKVNSSDRPLSPVVIEKVVVSE